jgi:hypothetical protein
MVGPTLGSDVLKPAPKRPRGFLAGAALKPEADAER